MDYDVSYRELSSSQVTRDACSKDKYHTQARFSRARGGRVVNGAHRRRAKRN